MAERESEALRTVFRGRFGQKCGEGSAAREEGLRRRPGIISKSRVLLALSSRRGRLLGGHMLHMWKHRESVPCGAGPWG